MDDSGKDPVRVEAGKKAAETRKEREGADVFKQMGKKGAEARFGTSGDDDSGQQSRSGNQGVDIPSKQSQTHGQSRGNSGDDDSGQNMGQRLRSGDSDAARELGQKGGQSRGGNKGRDRDDDE